MVGRHPFSNVFETRRDASLDLCVRRGEGEEELGIVSIAVVGKAMGRDHMAKRADIEEEEQRAKD